VRIVWLALLSVVIKVWKIVKYRLFPFGRKPFHRRMLSGEMRAIASFLKPQKSPSAWSLSMFRSLRKSIRGSLVGSPDVFHLVSISFQHIWNAV